MYGWEMGGEHTQGCLNIHAEGNQGLASLEGHTLNDLHTLISTSLKGSATSISAKLGPSLYHVDIIGHSAPNCSHEQTVECVHVNSKGTGRDN